jgi:hypothetical protein
MSTRCHQALFALVALLTLAGCGQDGPPLALVEGTVTLDGEPLPRAQLEFQPQRGSTSYGETDKSGHYYLLYTPTRDGAMLGEHTIRIITGGEIFDSETREMRVATERVPARYNVETTLKREVVDGNNVIDFELTSE